MSKLPTYIYVYASTRTGVTKENLSETFQDRKLFTALENMSMPLVKESIKNVTKDNILNNMTFDKTEILQLDVMTSSRKGMHFKLDNIIKQAKSMKNSPYNTVIIISSISALGNIESIKKYYKIFRDEKIGIICPDNTRESGLSEYSTFDLDFQKRCDSEYNRVFGLIENLEPSDFRDNRGCKGSDFTLSFRVAFWLYETFQISEDMAKQMAGNSKNGFHMKADRYEQTIMYKQELESFEKHFHISKTVKRNRPVPKNFITLIKSYNESGNLEQSCIDCKIPMIFPIDYKRLVLKNDGGKRELRKCLLMYDENLMRKFEKWVDEGKNPEKFYLQCRNVLLLLK